jgi:competence protein ComEC
MWQGLSIRALWPESPIGHSDNNGSCVIKIADDYHSILLPGDIDKSIERKLIRLNPELLKADILLAAHHGSNTSSSGQFIEAVGAKYVVFSQGFMNRWRFPRKEVLDRFQQVNNDTAKQNRLFSTSNSGQVNFTMQYNLPKPIVVKTFRQDIYPYWYANSSDP